MKRRCKAMGMVLYSNYFNKKFLSLTAQIIALSSILLRLLEHLVVLQLETVVTKSQRTCLPQDQWCKECIYRFLLCKLPFCGLFTYAKLTFWYVLKWSCPYNLYIGKFSEQDNGAGYLRTFWYRYFLCLKEIFTDRKSFCFIVAIIQFK